MNNFPSNVQDITNEFMAMANITAATNYQVHFDVKLFEGDFLNKGFNISSLKYLYDEKNIFDDEIKEVGRDNAIESINKHLQFTTDENAIDTNEDLYLVSKKEWEKRKEYFWNIVNKNISLQQHYKCYEYIPIHGHFYHHVFWNLNYIFLSESKGMFIHMCAFD